MGPAERQPAARSGQRVAGLPRGEPEEILGLSQIDPVLGGPVPQHQGPAEHQQPLGLARAAGRRLRTAVAQHPHRRADVLTPVR